jgi:hypothetical protein
LLLAASSIFGAGCCGTYYLALRTLVIEPAEYCFRIDGHQSRNMYREWAESALREETGCGAATMGGPDYAEGFEEGFVEYIYGGGTGEPPPVPPRKYWNVEWRDSTGKDRANQWFEGYRNGARLAADRGLRSAGIVQTTGVGLAKPVNGTARGNNGWGEYPPNPAAVPTSETPAFREELPPGTNASDVKPDPTAATAPQSRTVGAALPPHGPSGVPADSAPSNPPGSVTNRPESGNDLTPGALDLPRPESEIGPLTPPELDQTPKDESATRPSAEKTSRPATSATRSEKSRPQRQNNISTLRLVTKRSREADQKSPRDPVKRAERETDDQAPLVTHSAAALFAP